MTFQKWAFIYLGAGTEDPAVDRAVIDRGGIETTIVAVPDSSLVPRVAAELVDAGAQTIELCGAFGPEVNAQVVEATGGRIPVGSVTYSAQWSQPLADLFPEPEPAST